MAIVQATLVKDTAIITIPRTSGNSGFRFCVGQHIPKAHVSTVCKYCRVSCVFWTKTNQTKRKTAIFYLFLFLAFSRVLHADIRKKNTTREKNTHTYHERVQFYAERARNTKLLRRLCLKTFRITTRYWRFSSTNKARQRRLHRHTWNLPLLQNPRWTKTSIPRGHCRNASGCKEMTSTSTCRLALCKRG